MKKIKKVSYYLSNVKTHAIKTRKCSATIGTKKSNFTAILVARKYTITPLFANTIENTTKNSSTK